MRIAAFACILSLSAPGDVTADWTLTGFLGGSWTRDTSLTLMLPAADTNLRLSPVHYDSASFEAPPYYGYRLAFFPRSMWLGVEGELIHMKVIADTSRQVHVEGTLRGVHVDGSGRFDLLERFSITHGVNLLLVNAVVRRNVGLSRVDGRPRLIASARIGAGASVPHPESTVDGTSFDSYEWGALSMQGAAGIEFRMGGPVYVTAEYKLSRTVQDVTIAGGSARTPLVSQHVVGGLVLHIGAK